MKNTGTVSLNSQKVEELIESKGLKKRFIAKETGLHPGTLSRALKLGHARRTTVMALARVLGVLDSDIAA